MSTTPQQYYLYMIECQDGSYYTGYTINLVRRYLEHTSGDGGARYTRSRQPIRLAQAWSLCCNIKQIMQLEIAVKKLSPRRKAELTSIPQLLWERTQHKITGEIEPSIVDLERVHQLCSEQDLKYYRSEPDPLQM